MPPFVLSMWGRLSGVGRWLGPSLMQHLHRPNRRTLWGLLAAGPVLLLLYTLLLIPFTPAISDIRKAKTEQPAQVLSRDGKLLAEYKWAHRQWVPLKGIAPAVVDALIATEDHRFYQHWGMDGRRLVGAALATFSGDRQGGSTITQQLARNLFPEEIGRAPTLTRKLKEAITAFKIELLYSKEEILETYLNTVPFLYNAYGIEMAARTYFDTSADKLTVLQSATLIGMLKGTSYYNPVLNPERAQNRRNTVLAQMVKRDKLKPAQFEALKKRPLRIEFERQAEPQGPAPHFSQQLRKWLIAWADRNGYNLYTDGLVIHTTIDSRLQAVANQAVARQGRQLQAVADAAWSQRNGWQPRNPLVETLVRESTEFRAAVAKGQTPDEAAKALLADVAFLRTLRQTKVRVQAGFLALEPETGQIRAWVGSRDFAQDAFDHVQQARRQPGSTFKPFVYGAAFEQGLNPTDTLIDQAVEIKLPGGEVWRPSDGGPPSGQAMSLRTALAQSKNTITAQLMQQVGPERVVELARVMGVRDSKLDPVPALALGTSPVTLKEMVAAYGTIANTGRYVEPLWVTRIENRRGELLQEFASARPQKAMPVQAAQDLRNALRGVIDQGTGRAIRTRYGIQADVAGKTGTTQDNADGWFILLHPQLVAGAWAGFNDSRITLRSDHWGQGARSALPMVGEFFQQALRSKQIDAQVRFVDTPRSRWWQDFKERLRDWLQDWWASRPVPEKIETPPTRPAVPVPAPVLPTAPEITESTAVSGRSGALPIETSPVPAWPDPPPIQEEPPLQPLEMQELTPSPALPASGESSF
ncbi:MULTISPECIES: penicillin-binding protein 1A [Giesbergeria]|uniref:Penicillin-binding protein 1A n=1 Tax=Giesbergeria sinuosa TaxID=80883 RepID=A0ABV9QH04_9BURK